MAELSPMMRQYLEIKEQNPGIKIAGIINTKK